VRDRLLESWNDT
jgi:glycogen phosphorylase